MKETFYQRHLQRLKEKGTDWKPVNLLQLELIQLIEKLTETLELLKETVEDNNTFADPQTIDTYVMDAYQTTAKLCSCLDCEMYILYMENAALIRYNMIQLNNFIGSMEMFGEEEAETGIEENYLQVLKEEYTAFKEKFTQWTALFEKDDFIDEWNLFK